jgi:hypothetical protein
VLFPFGFTRSALCCWYGLKLCMLLAREWEYKKLYNIKPLDVVHAMPFSILRTHYIILYVGYTVPSSSNNSTRQAGRKAVREREKQSVVRAHYKKRSKTLNSVCAIAHEILVRSFEQRRGRVFGLWRVSEWEKMKWERAN